MLEKYKYSRPIGVDWKLVIAEGEAKNTQVFRKVLVEKGRYFEDILNCFLVIEVQEMIKNFCQNTSRKQSQHYYYPRLKKPL